MNHFIIFCDISISSFSDIAFSRLHVIFSIIAKLTLQIHFFIWIPTQGDAADKRQQMSYPLNRGGTNSNLSIILPILLFHIVFHVQPTKNPLANQLIDFEHWQGIVHFHHQLRNKFTINDFRNVYSFSWWLL